MTTLKCEKQTPDLIKEQGEECSEKSADPSHREEVKRDEKVSSPAHEDRDTKSLNMYIDRQLKQISDTAAYVIEQDYTKRKAQAAPERQVFSAHPPWSLKRVNTYCKRALLANDTPWNTEYLATAMQVTCDPANGIIMLQQEIKHDLPHDMPLAHTCMCEAT